MQAGDQLEASTQAQPEGVWLKGPSSSCLHPPSPRPARVTRQPPRARLPTALSAAALAPRSATRASAGPATSPGAAAVGATPERWDHDCHPRFLSLLAGRNEHRLSAEPEVHGSEGRCVGAEVVHATRY